MCFLTPAQRSPFRQPALAYSAFDYSITKRNKTLRVPLVQTTNCVFLPYFETCDLNQRFHLFSLRWLLYFEGKAKDSPSEKIKEKFNYETPFPGIFILIDLRYYCLSLMGWGGGKENHECTKLTYLLAIKITEQEKSKRKWRKRKEIPRSQSTRTRKWARARDKTQKNKIYLIFLLY